MENYFSCFSTKTCCGYSKELSHRDRFLSTQNTCINWWVRNNYNFTLKKNSNPNLGQKCFSLLRFEHSLYNSRTECEAGYFSLGGQKQCTPCEEGYYCPYTTEGQTLCSAGQYSDGRSINCTTCEAGYYCPNTKGKVPVFKRCELLWSVHHWRTHNAVLGSTVMVDQSTVQHAKLAIIVQTQKVKYQVLKGGS